MTERKWQAYKQKVANGLLKIALLFSVFAFLGYSKHLEAASQVAIKTELLLSSNSQSTTAIFVIGQSIHKPTFWGYFSIASTVHKFVVLQYNQYLKTVFRKRTNLFLSYKWSLLPARSSVYLPQSNLSDDLSLLAIR